MLCCRLDVDIGVMVSVIPRISGHIEFMLVGPCVWSPDTAWSALSARRTGSDCFRGRRRFA